MADIINSVLTRYKADVNPHKRSIKQLKGAQKAQAKEALSQMEKQNQKIDKQIAMWGKAVVAIGAVAGAYKALSAGLEVYEKNATLRMATVGVSINGLRDSTFGLVDDTRLLEFAAASMNGTFKLTQGEVEAVLKGTVAMRKTIGVELPEALNKVQKAIKEGNVEGLKKLGIVMRESAGTSDALAATVEAVSSQYEMLGGNVDLATDAVRRNQTSFANSVDSFQEEMGKMAVALAPIVADLAKAVEFAMELYHLSSKDNSSTGAQHEAQRMFDEREELQKELAKRLRGGGRTFGFWTTSDQELEDQIRQRTQAIKGLEKLADQDIERERKKFREARKQKEIDAVREEERAKLAERLKAKRNQSKGSGFTINGEVLEGQVIDFVPLEKQRQNFMDSLNQDGTFASPDFAGSGVSLEEPSQLMQTLAQQTDFAAMAYGNLESSAVNAYSAIVDGSASASDAAKMIVATSVKALGQEMAVNSIKQMALGIAALANPFTASTAGAHFKSAAMFAAGATAAGVAASSLSGGRGGSGSPTPVTSGLGANGAGQGDGGRTVLYLIGEDFSEKPARQRLAEFRGRARKAGLEITGDVVERS